MTPPKDIKDIEEEIVKETLKQVDNILERVDLVRHSLSIYRTNLLKDIESAVEARIIEFYPADTAEKRKKLAMHISNLLK